MFKTIAAFTTGLVVGGITVASLILEEKMKSIDIVEGDVVQWESNGVFMFPTPRKVVKIENSEFGKYVFVENSKTGIPIKEVFKA